MTAHRVRRTYHAFLCYAGEDRERVTQPLEEMLTRAGLKIWTDYRELHVGDRLLQRVTDGMQRARFGIVVLSPSFFDKQWPKTELETLFTLDRSGRCQLLPVWHDITVHEVEDRAPWLATRLAVETRDGIMHVATELHRQMTGYHSAEALMNRKRMIELRKCGEIFSSDLQFSIGQVTEMTGIKKIKLFRWLDAYALKADGIWPNATFSARSLVVISALHCWSACGMKVTGRVAALLHYAVHSARSPFVIIWMTGDYPSISTIEPYNVASKLTGAPLSAVYDPERLLLEAYNQMRGKLEVSLSSRPELPAKIERSRIRHDPKSVSEQLLLFDAADV